MIGLRAALPPDESEYAMGQSQEDIELLDVRGLRCPLPVLKARKALRGIAPGACLEVLATDPASVIDFRHFCDTTRYELVNRSEADGIFTFRIKNPDA